MGIWRSRSMDGRVAVIKFVVYIVKEQGIRIRRGSEWQCSKV